MHRSINRMIAFVLAGRAMHVAADDAPPDKSDYTLFNPTPAQRALPESETRSRD